MKKFFVVLFLALIVSAAFAQGSSIIAPRQIPTEELRVRTFDNLVRSTYCALTSAQHVTPNDTSSTGTYSSAYLGTLNGPLKLRIQNLGTTGKIYFKEYALSGTNVASTSATSPYLQSTHGNYLATGTAGQLAPGEVVEMYYFDEPDLMFGGVEAATFSIQVFQPSPANY
jgi:hypothetical protein